MLAGALWRSRLTALRIHTAKSTGVTEMWRSGSNASLMKTNGAECCSHVCRALGSDGFGALHCGDTAQNPFIFGAETHRTVPICPKIEVKTGVQNVSLTLFHASSSWKMG